MLRSILLHAKIKMAKCNAPIPLAISNENGSAQYEPPTKRNGSSCIKKKPQLKCKQRFNIFTLLDVQCIH